MIKVEIKITILPDVLDPESNALEENLRKKHDKIKELKVAKYLEFRIDTDQQTAYDTAKDICENVLCNPNIETYKIKIIDEY